MHEGAHSEQTFGSRVGLSTPDGVSGSCSFSSQLCSSFLRSIFLVQSSSGLRTQGFMLPLVIGQPTIGDRQRLDGSIMSICGKAVDLCQDIIAQPYPPHYLQMLAPGQLDPTEWVFLGSMQLQDATNLVFIDGCKVLQTCPDLPDGLQIACLPYDQPAPGTA